MRLGDDGAPRVLLAYLRHARCGVTRARMLDSGRLGAHEVRTEQVERGGGGVRLDLVRVRVRVRIRVKVRLRLRLRVGLGLGLGY